MPSDHVSPANFRSNYPHFRADAVTILPTPERTDALREFGGDDVTIAYVDSGFSRHEDIEGRVILHADASTHHIIETPHVVETSPLSWHGQMTSVIGSGDGRSSQGVFTSIAPRSKLVLVKVSTPDGRIKEPDILRGLRWIYETHHRTNVRIVNVSVGGDFVTDDPNNPLFVVVRRLHHAGITVVVSSGNANAEYMVPPASAPHALTIGGYDDQNSLDPTHWKLYPHNFTRTIDDKTKPELIAPSAWIASPLLPESETAHEIAWLAQVMQATDEHALLSILQAAHGKLGLLRTEVETLSDELITRLQARIYHHKVITERHQHVDGTSVAAPLVSAVIAQMLQVNPHLTPDDIRHILTTTAQPMAGIPAYKQGAGILRARDAVLMAQAYTPSIFSQEQLV